MGGLVSSARSEDRQKIRSHEADLAGTEDGDAGEGILDGDPRRAVQWYHWMIYDMRFRILYSTVLAIGLGIGIPLLIYVLAFSGTQNEKFGSCLINPEFRFECLINYHYLTPNEDECNAGHGCFSDDPLVPFKCHHSFPSAYQYEIGDIASDPQNGSGVIDLTLRPRNPPKMAQLKLTAVWRAEDHLEVEISDAALGGESIAESAISKGHLLISHGAESQYFFLHLRRNDSLETIFDTRLGPVLSEEGAFSFSTILPSKYFWGLKGGQGGAVTSTVVNGPGSAELPFYMALEESGSVHGLLVETVAPFIFQYIEAPAALFHFQAETNVKLHFFPGPTPADVYAQVQKFNNGRRSALEAQNERALPPYWALGLHLCRHGFNGSETLQDLSALSGNGGNLKPIPYDSDCVDEALRKPFAINDSAFPEAELTQILSRLEADGRKVLLSQRMGLEVIAENETRNSAPLIFRADGSPLIGRQASPSNRSDEGTAILFPDYFHPDAAGWASADFGSGLSAPFLQPFSDLFSGLVLVDNFPSTRNSSGICGNHSGVASRIGLTFTLRDLICADSVHSNAGRNSSHLSLHNAFGQESLRVLRGAFESWMGDSDRRAPLVGVSTWTQLANQDGSAGLQVPFTWTGLIDSLNLIIRNFVLNPVLVGTPICGSFLEEKVIADSESAEELEDDEIADDLDHDLCLRWFQLGLLLPFARNTRVLNGTSGPQDLRYRPFVIASVENRYRLNPYYYTELYEATLNPAPLIRPLIYDFHSAEEVNATREISDQFMIGRALMAAPILSEAPTRDAYFPKGIWYDLHGNLVVDASDAGRSLTIPSLLAEIPLFIASGHIIPILNKPVEGTAERTRAGNYTLLATFPQLGATSRGTLFVDDGESLNSTSSGSFNYASFTCTAAEFTIAAPPCGLATSSAISTTIDVIKIIGFPHNREVVSVETVSPPRSVDFIQDGAEEETGSLRLINLDADWCTDQHVTFKWTFAQL